jgi:hypothetical protein
MTPVNGIFVLSEHTSGIWTVFSLLSPYSSNFPFFFSLLGLLFSFAVTAKALAKLY